MYDTLISLTEGITIARVIQTKSLGNEVQLHAAFPKCLVLAVEVLQTVAQALLVG